MRITDIREIGSDGGTQYGVRFAICADAETITNRFVGKGARVIKDLADMAWSDALSTILDAGYDADLDAEGRDGQSLVEIVYYQRGDEDRNWMPIEYYDVPSEFRAAADELRDNAEEAMSNVMTNLYPDELLIRLIHQIAKVVNADNHDEALKALPTTHHAVHDEPGDYVEHCLEVWPEGEVELQIDAECTIDEGGIRSHWCLSCATTAIVIAEGYDGHKASWWEVTAPDLEAVLRRLEAVAAK